MRFNLRRPCKDCPFIQGSRTNTTLAEGRIESIVSDLMDGMTFACHKTIEFKSSEQEHCAGALQYLEREERPNQLMRIAERIGLYDHRKLEQCAELIEPIH
ncbi:hypothetical protein [Paenibacillus alba]|uniref:Uncharacterized protein n=1 Tax=Paenibacillus alba TaxID=1197127 RepID=A0ABU6FVL1_9BACL|nr:hypothetical protein [Paenibacillus alba]MEC0225926.1 hypothetical protein [Paenibacillus alba]